MKKHHHKDPALLLMRQRIAEQAAQYLGQGVESDWQAARHRAALTLDMTNPDHWPDYRTILDALAAYHRLFSPTDAVATRAYLERVATVLGLFEPLDIRWVDRRDHADFTEDSTVHLVMSDEEDKLLVLRFANLGLAFKHGKNAQLEYHFEAFGEAFVLSLLGAGAWAQRLHAKTRSQPKLMTLKMISDLLADLLADTLSQTVPDTLPR